MSDERISPTPNPPRCPVCATGFTGTPGVSCPACRVPIAPADQPPIPNFRLPFENRLLGYDKPVYFGLGILFLLSVASFAYSVPGILIPFAVLLVPAVLRTIRLTNRPAVYETQSTWGQLIGAIISSFGVAALAGMASTVAFSCLCIGFEGHNFWTSMVGAVVGSLGGLIVFLVIFIKLWPRDWYDEMPRSPDPEN